MLALIASSASHPCADVPTVAQALHRVCDFNSERTRQCGDRQRESVLTGLTSDPAQRVRPLPVLVHSLPDTLVAPGESCRSTFCFLPALCAIGSVSSIDSDIPYALAEW